MKVEVNAVPSFVDAADMKVGQAAIVRGAVFSDNVGITLLRTYLEWVDLAAPNRTWTNPAPPFKVELLKPGSKIALTVEE